MADKDGLKMVGKCYLLILTHYDIPFSSAANFSSLAVIINENYRLEAYASFNNSSSTFKPVDAESILS